MGADTISAVYTGWYLAIAFGAGMQYHKNGYSAGLSFMLGILWPLSVPLVAVLDCISQS